MSAGHFFREGWEMTTMIAIIGPERTIGLGKSVPGEYMGQQTGQKSIPDTTS